MTAQRPLAAGLWSILATPFTPDDEVDAASMRRQVELAATAGAQGLVALGVFGEGASLDLREQRRTVHAVVEADSRLPVVVGLSARSTAVALEQADVAVEAAGDRLEALMVQVNSTSTAVVTRHLHRIHEVTGADVVLQDYPLVSGVRVSSADILEVLAQCPFVVAVKAEAPPTPPAIAQLTAGTAVPVFGGLGGVGLVDELACGAAGAMTGFSHPEGLRQTLDAYSRGGFAAAREAWEPWLPLATFEAQQGIGLALRKQLLHRRGVLAHPAVRPPAAPAPAALTPLLDRHLQTVPADLLCRPTS